MMRNSPDLLYSAGRIVLVKPPWHRGFGQYWLVVFETPGGPRSVRVWDEPDIVPPLENETVQIVRGMVFISARAYQRWYDPSVM